MKPRNAHALAGAVLATTMVSLLAPVAWAQDDGGGRSILADGAGNRALSLGGAYAAVADDASAVVWNPGGLGFVQRREFQATYTDLLGMGFNEQYASFVLPSWRWGVGSLTFRRFGVGGIEERDDRNALIDSDLSDNETELTFGYGREIGDAWSLGGALKVRNHSLAGYSDSGIGLDLGVLLRPLMAFGGSRESARNLSFGVAVRNVVEPSLRLNEEPVTDPTGFRAGGAYRWQFGRDTDLLVTMDAEKTRDMNTHFHTGLEVGVARLLALRAGVNQGRFVAGAGVHWREMGVDYQFEDHPSGFFHRFGVALKFGPTRDESRQRAQSLEEQQLQQRLDTAFAGQMNQRKTELLTRAQNAVRQRDTEEASNLLATLKVIDPDAVDLPVLEAEILVLQATDHEAAGDYAAAMVALRRAVALDPYNNRAAAMLERIRAVGDRENQRTAEIRSLLDRALDSFAAGDLREARRGFEQVLTLAPDDSEAQAMLVLTDLATTTRVEGHLAQLRILTNAGQFDRARQELTAARDLDPLAPGLDEAAKFLADRKARGLAAPKVETPDRAAKQAGGSAAPTSTVAVPSFTVEQRREMDDLYQRGMAAMEAGQKDQAIHLWEVVWSMDPDYKNVTEYLAQNYLARGMEFFVAGDLPDAVTNWEAAVRVNPTDPKALGYLQRAKEQTERMKMMDD